MKTAQLSIATRYRDNAFTTAGKSLMIVMMEDIYYVCSRREAAALVAQGYEAF